MNISFTKYQAIGNDFIIIDESLHRLTKNKLSDIAQAICNRRYGVGADGIIYLKYSPNSSVDAHIEIYNADGGWAEKSGNGLRIAATYLNQKKNLKKIFQFQTGAGVCEVRLIKKLRNGFISETNIGHPSFLSADVPVKSKHKFHVNSPLDINGTNFPITCLSVGNPHAVLIVDDFNFDWHLLGEDIENGKPFPEGTNVEFVKPMNRKRIKVAEWERGAGTTESSGTGAAAAVCTTVMLGITDRKCVVEFEAGEMQIEWKEEGDIIITGPAQLVMHGEYVYK